MRECLINQNYIFTEKEKTKLTFWDDRNNYIVNLTWTDFPAHFSESVYHKSRKIIQMPKNQ